MNPIIDTSEGSSFQLVCPRPSGDCPLLSNLNDRPSKSSPFFRRIFFLLKRDEVGYTHYIVYIRVKEP